jgi:23S rRNA (guanosine2251-2'-O)-methyltransferase
MPVSDSERLKSMVLTGFHAISEYIAEYSHSQAAVSPDSKVSLRLLYAKTGPRVRALIAAAEAAVIPVEQVTADALDTLTGGADHRGAALIDDGANQKEMPVTLPSSLDAFVRGLAPDTGALVVLLNGITDPHNLGAILRSCDQFDVDLVVCPKRNSAAGESAVVQRASSGAASWVPTAEVANLSAAIVALQEAGFWVYGADARGTAASRVSFAPRAALVLGSEGAGMSRLVSKHCDTIVAIPTHGHVDSLNVSVAAGILLYEIRRTVYV